MRLKNFAALVGLSLAIAAGSCLAYGEINKDVPGLRAQAQEHGVVMGLASLFSFSFVKSKDSYDY